MKTPQIVRIGINMVLLCTIIILSPLSIISQDFGPENLVIPPSPTASSIAKYGDIPVGLYTGIPSINVPLYQFKSRMLSIPISLNYHAGGHKVDAVSGWTGLGWSLSCNYMISRTVRGAFADEDQYGYSNNPVMDEFDGGILDINNFADEVKNMAEGRLDGEPDLFHFSIPSGSGSFVYDFNSNVAHIQPYQDTKIKWLGPDDGFLIVDNQGHKYIFNDIEETKSESIDCADPMGGATFQTTGWYLTKIIEANEMDEINFSYLPTDISYKSGVTQTKYFDNLPFPSVCKRAPDPSDCISTLRTTGQLLAEISSPYTGTVIFNSSTGRLDLEGGGKLDDIVVKNSDNVIRRFMFSYDYFNSSGQTAAENDQTVFKRLKLQAVSDLPSSGDNIPPYNFFYEENIPLPPRLSFGQDHWGYANGEFNLTLLPSRILTEMPFIGGDRNTNEDYANAFMLQRIEYPTGGYNEFDFESNSWGSFTAENLLQFSSDYISQIVTVELDSLDPQYSEENVSFDLPHGLMVQYDVQAYSTDSTAEWNGRIDLFDSDGNSYCQGSYPEGLFCEDTDGYPNGSNSGTMWLPQGTYTLSIAKLTTQDYTKVILNWEQHEIYTDSLDINTINEIYVGGARIKTLKTGDGINTANDQIKHYEYKKWDNAANTDLSSGKLVTPPRYTFNLRTYRPLIGLSCDNNTCTFRGLSSTSKAPLGITQGSHIAYTNVAVYEGVNKDLGKTETTFTYANDKGGTGFPFGPQTSYDFKRGLLLTQTDYKGSLGNYTPIRKIENTYNFREESQVNHSLMHGLNVAYYIQGQNLCAPTQNIVCSEEDVETVYFGNCNGQLNILNIPFLSPWMYPNYICDTVAYHPCYGLVPNTILTNTLFEDQFSYRSYAFLSNWFSLQSTRDSTDGVEKITLYEYDEIEGKHTNIAESKILNSDGKWYSSEYFYAPDLINIDPYAFDLDQRNMIARPLKEVQKVDDVLTGGKHTIMTSIYLKILPQKIFQVLSDGSELLRTTLLYFSDGYPKKQIPLSGQNETYTWNNGRLTSRTLLDNWSWTYEYDEVIWQLEKTTNMDGLSSEFIYDGYQRLSQSIAKAGGATKSTTDYSYQIGGGNNIVSETSSFPDGTTTQSNTNYFDGLGRSIQTDINGIPKQETQYDNLGRIAAQTYLPGIFKSFEYEPSPLKRVTKEIYPDGGEMSTEYGNSGNLYQQIITDENGNKTKTKTDILGRQESITDNNGGVTRNIYDIISNIKQVNPPVSPTSGDPFVYRYDLRNRVEVKTIPGSGEQRFLYNEKDLLVASQDANLLADSRWLVTSYDQYNRPIKSGFYNGDATGVDLNSITPHEVLSETYYDSYDNLVGFPPELGGGSGCNSGIILQGKIIGTKVNILDGKDQGSEWLYTINCIDEFGRVAGLRSSNHLDGKDIINTVYDLADNVLQTQRSHEISGINPMLITQEFDYDNFFRPTKTWHQINDGPKPMISWSKYNDQDLLETKYLGYNESANLAPEYLQKIDYEYNVRGWLTKINDVDELSSEKLPLCGDDLDPPPTCPATCDYTVSLPCGESTFITGIYINGGQLMDINYPLGCFNTNLIQESIVGWLNANGAVYGSVQVYLNGVGDLVIAILESKVVFNYVQAPSVVARDDLYYFKSTNCSGKVEPTDPCQICKDAGFPCERCPLLSIQDPCITCGDLGLPCSQCEEEGTECDLCIDLGYSTCDVCPLTVKAISPMRINLAYDLTEVTSSNSNSYLVQLTELSRHFLHDGTVNDWSFDKMMIVGDEPSISDFNPIHLMELEIYGQTILSNNLGDVVNYISSLAAQELTIAGITDQVAIDEFIAVLEVSLNAMWVGQATSDQPLGPPVSLENPDIFAMDLYYNEGNTLTGTSGQKNGNISGITWGVHGGNKQSHGFNYDGLNRLENAIHASEVEEGVWENLNKYGMVANYDAVGNILNLRRYGVNDICESPSGILYDYGQIDELTYFYGSGNRISSITESIDVEHGFKGIGGTISYDGNGNMTNVGYKNSQMAYNHLNLPYQMMKGENSIDWKYAADGRKLQKLVNAADPTVSYVKDYSDGIEYNDVNLEAIYHECGRVIRDEDENLVYEYYLKDHLGNVRVVFSDTNDNGFLEPVAEGGEAVPDDYSELMQENHYYPFGMQMDGPWEEIESEIVNDYLYNEKELNTEFGLDWLDYGARWYDASIGRWNAVDPLADALKLVGMSPYSAMANNPITHIDPDGRCFQKVGDEYVPCDDGNVGDTRQGVFGNDWTFGDNGWKLTNGADPSTVNYEYDHFEATGNPDYYTDRYKNHIEKYNTRPPNYYLGYGHKYINRFKNETRAKLSEYGKMWVDKTAIELQLEMNSGLSEDPSLQSNDNTFQRFAYDTHVPAYENGGALWLSGSDLLRVGLTPDASDIFTISGIRQGLHLGARVYGARTFFSPIEARKRILNKK